MTSITLPQPPLSSASLPVRIGPHDRITINGTQYGYAKPIEGFGYMLSRLDTQPRLVEEFSFEQLSNLRDTARYTYDRNWFAPGRKVTPGRQSLDRLSDIDDRELPKVLWKLEWVARFLSHEVNGNTTRSDQSMQALRPTIYAEICELEIAKSRRPGSGRKRMAGAESIVRDPPSIRRWRDWITSYELSGHNPCVLRDNRRNNGNRSPQVSSKITSLMWEFTVKYAQSHRPKKKHLYTDLCEAIDALPENVEAQSAGRPPVFAHPSLKTFCKAINKHDQFDIYAGRNGLKAAKIKYAMISAGTDVTRPFQRIEIDEWQVSLMTLLVDSGLWGQLTVQQQEECKGRMWICVAIDCATRCIVGMRLVDTPSSANVMATLRMAVSDKTDYATAAGALSPWDMRGSPEQVVSDSGSSFIADIVQAAIINLSAAPKIPPIDLTYFRGRIERVFGTVHTALISRFHGRTFADTVELGDYNPKLMANLDRNEIARILVRFVVDAYHNMPHCGLGGETPFNAWLRLTKLFGVIEPPDRDKKRAIFGVKLKRKLRTGGIHILGLSYNSEHLESYRRRVGEVEVDVCLDQEDIGLVSVKVGAEWLTVPCVRSGFDRISVRAWIETIKDLRRRFTDEAIIAEPIVRQAIKDIQTISTEAARRMGIGDHIDTPEMIEQAEQNLAIGFLWANSDADNTVNEANLFSQAYPAGGDDPKREPERQPAPPIRPTNFRMED